MKTDFFRAEAYEDIVSNPIDYLEGLFHENNWPFLRPESNEMIVETSGGWCDYQMHFVWHKDLHAFYFTCAYDMKIPTEQRDALAKLLCLINENMWMGHFELAETGGAPIFRHTILTRGLSDIPLSLLEEIMEVGLDECERFFPAFKSHIWGGQSAEEAIASALLQCAGEA